MANHRKMISVKIESVRESIQKSVLITILKLKLASTFYEGVCKKYRFLKQYCANENNKCIDYDANTYKSQWCHYTIV